MNRQTRRLSAAALALVVCLATTPVASARQDREGGRDFSERIIRIIAKIQNAFRVGSQADVLVPPRP